MDKFSESEIRLIKTTEYRHEAATIIFEERKKAKSEYEARINSIVDNIIANMSNNGDSDREANAA